MRPAFHSDRSRPRTGAAPALAALVILSSCTDYKQMQRATGSIWDVRVTTRPGDVAACRLIGGVDSRDTERGCGLTVQPTFEECLRYQVRMAGGDTLLMNGPIGEAYDCSGQGAGRETAPATPPATPTRSPTPTAAPAVPPAATAAPQPAAPLSETPTSVQPRPRVRVTEDHDAAKGCVYLGDVVSATTCADEHGEVSADCAREALEAGGDLILREGARAQIFSCKARP